MKVVHLLRICLCYTFTDCVWAVTMAPFLRITFNAYELGVLSPVAEAPFCAVKLKESLSTGEWVSRCIQSVWALVVGGFLSSHTHSLDPCLLLDRGKTLIQRKPTMFPAWRASFDAHIYEGRVLQVLLMRTADEPLAEVTLGVSVLAERCKKASGRSEFWVCMHVHGCVFHSVFGGLF